MLQRAGRRPPSPSRLLAPAPPSAAQPLATASASTLQSSGAAAEARPAGALPTFLDVYGEEYEADPRLTELVEDEGQTEADAKTGSISDLSAEGGVVPRPDQETARATGVKQEFEEMQTDDFETKPEISSVTETIKSEDMTDELGNSLHRKSTSFTDSAQKSASCGDASVKCDDSATGGARAASGRAQEEPADEQAAPDADDAVSRLDPALADKYRHLTDSSFKQEFLANLIGNQDRDWDNLRSVSMND